MKKVRQTKAQKLARLRALPFSKKQGCRMICHKGRMSGRGVKEIMQSVGRYLGPIAKEVGPVVLKEWLIPYLKSKIAGNGLKLAGSGKKTIYY